MKIITVTTTKSSTSNRKATVIKYELLFRRIQTQKNKTSSIRSFATSKAHTTVPKLNTCISNKVRAFPALHVIRDSTLHSVITCIVCIRFQEALLFDMT